MDNLDKNLGVLDTPWKLKFYPNRILALLDGYVDRNIPVTVHFAPTLRCNHQCYFCTYGNAKKNNSNMEMPLENAKRYICQLKEAGVEGLIFTGGGDPLCHNGIIEMMETCNKVGLTFSINTNGLALTPELSEKILHLKPAYIRVSINAGSRAIQEIMSSVDDFEKVLKNFEALMRNRIMLDSDTPLSIAYVVGVTNYFDVENLYEQIAKVEKRVYEDLKVHVSINITIRPIYNYECSKLFNLPIYEKTMEYLRKRSSEEADEYERFIKNGEQTSHKFLNEAVETIKNRLWKKTKQGEFENEPCDHEIKVYFPAEKFKSIGITTEKPYEQCLGLCFYAFVWPDGNIFPCVEYAGTNGFDIGNLNEKSAKDIFSSEERRNKNDWINKCVVHKRCAKICAYHEVNCYLDKILKGDAAYKSKETTDNIPMIAKFI